MSICERSSTIGMRSPIKSQLPWDRDSLWRCPVCDAVNAYNERDRKIAARFLAEDVVICRGSCFDNVCGGCGANIVEPDSPILAQCYTHRGE